MTVAETPARPATVTAGAGAREVIYIIFDRITRARDNYHRDEQTR